VTGGDIQLTALERGDRERLVVLFREYNAVHLVGVRLHVRSRDGWVPTSRGGVRR
jgi:hypothetical protein